MYFENDHFVKKSNVDRSFEIQNKMYITRNEGAKDVILRGHRGQKHISGYSNVIIFLNYKQYI